ncbi:MAG: Ig-like domain repeat protein, partial [Candidatus Pacebacteria bacterium]|nr:Ig-like domain repeat protein [Candidatus Paceibacterota bacterium]
PPYGFEFDSTAVANGTHTVYAIACDIAGNCTTSTTATFTINNPDITPPATVAITVPTAGAILAGNATLTAIATDNIGIDHIDFYRGTTLIGGVIGTAPYTWNTTNTPDGIYILTAKAYDAAGNSKTSAGVSIEVKNSIIPPADTTLPIVTMTTPASGTTVSGTTVTLAADATDASGINNVKFYRSGSATALDTDLTPYPGTNNYAITWDSKTVANGTYTITAKATDGSANANVGTSAGITVTVYNDITAPSVTIAAPATAGQNIVGTFILKATATDNVSMAPPGKVEFYRGGTTLIGSTQVPGTGSNFEFSWTTTSVANGTYSITAKAYDAAGNVKTSTSRNVVVDNTAPTISNTTTGGYYKAGTRLALKATATDANMAKVEFYVNGVLKCTDPSSAYTCSWTMPSTANSSFTITAKAYDKAGNNTTSAAVKVKNYTGTEVINLPITLSNLRANETSGITTVLVDATATSPVTKVDFYVDGVLIGADTSGMNPYSVTWNTTTVSNGTHMLSVEAITALGDTATSYQSVTIAN